MRVRPANPPATPPNPPLDPRLGPSTFIAPPATQGRPNQSHR
jgi:hypothetical protein